MNALCGGGELCPALAHPLPLYCNPVLLTQGRSAPFSAPHQRCTYFLLSLSSSSPLL